MEARVTVTPPPYAGRRYHRALPNLVPGALLVSTSPENVSTRHQWFAPARLRDPHLTGIPCLFRQRSRQWPFAAWRGLKPAPESRLRYPSSSIQLRNPDGLAFVTHDPLIFTSGCLSMTCSKASIIKCRPIGCCSHRKAVERRNHKALMAVTACCPLSGRALISL